MAFIDPSVDPQSRTIRVRVELDNKEGLLKPQMYVRAAARMRMGESLVIPRSAVLSTGRRTVVWVEVQPNMFEPRDVQTGMSDEANIEILNGVAEGDMVAVSGGFLLDSESSLQAPSSADPHAGHAAPSGGRQREAPRDTAPGVETPHEGHGAGGPAGDADARPVHQVRDIPVDVDVHYMPDVVRAKPGEHLRLLFTRRSDENCTGELVFPTLKIRKTLPVGRMVAVELTVEKPGAIPFACGMDMVKGSLVVE